MDRQKIVKNIEEYLRSFRDQVEKNEGSGFGALTEGAKSCLSGLKASILENERARSAAGSLRDYAEKLEQAARKGDKQLTSKALDLMEKALRDLRAKQDDEADSSKNDDEGKPSA